GRDALELFPVEVGKERNALEEFGRALCHARTMPHWNGETHGRRVFAGLAQSWRRAVGLPGGGVGAPPARLRSRRPAPASRTGRLAAGQRDRDHALPPRSLGRLGALDVRRDVRAGTRATE